MCMYESEEVMRNDYATLKPPTGRGYWRKLLCTNGEHINIFSVTCSKSGPTREKRLKHEEGERIVENKTWSKRLIC